ncbi:MAG: DNA polymerase III subunit delta [Flammeovirgaceae bacterium]|nr:DNA polymerase III subunit delta [Flammeovirgaceae bacterium]
MDSSAKKILADLKARKWEPVYILQGEETYYIDLISSYIEQNVLTDSERSFNQMILYGRDTLTHTMLTHARRYPMMAEKQVIIVREAQDMPDLQKESGSKLFLNYLENVVPSTVLVLCFMHKSLDKRKELGKKAGKLAVSVSFKKMYDNQLPDFVREYVKSAGFIITEGGVNILCEYVGTNLSRLANEIDKLVSGKEKGTKIDEMIVMSHVGISREYNIFELQKAIVNRDPVTAAKIVNYFEANTRKNPLIPAVAYLFSFFSKLLGASMANDTSERGLVSELKISPFMAKDYSRALRNYSTDKIISSISLIKNADLKLKGVNAGSADEGQVLKELVTQVMI